MLQDGDFNLVQSNSIARYLARKYNLYGDEKTGAVADMIIDSHCDFINKLVPTIYPVFDQEKHDAFKKDVVSAFLGALEKILLNYSDFLGKDSLVLGDLALFLIVEDYIMNYKFANEEDYPSLISHFKKVSTNENLAKYVNSDKRYPVHSFIK